MNGKRLIGSVWFWMALLLVGVTVGVFSYTLYLRQAAEELVQAQLQLGWEFVGALKKIQDEDGMQAVLPKLRELQQQGKTLEQRAAGLPKPSTRLTEELNQRYQKEWKDLRQEMVLQYQRITSLPDGLQFWEELEKMQQVPVWSSFHQQGQTP